MHSLRHLTLRFLLCAVAVVYVAAGSPAAAQRHSSGSAPPTAPLLPTPPASARSLLQPAPVVRQPPAQQAHTGAAPAALSAPIAAISTGLGAIQFAPANVETPAPQSLLRQLSSEDERTRQAALAALGAPGQYLARGRVPFPHSMQLDLLQLGNTDELDAVLTAELDQHVLSAILTPDGMNWKRVATLSFASSFSGGATTPSTFLRPLRSWLEPGRYRAVYHATVSGPNGDFIENEADVRVLNGRAVVVLSFVSGARQCDGNAQAHPQHPGCELLQRWLESDPGDPTHHFTLVTGVGHTPLHEAAEPLVQSRNYRLTRLRTFACQPFAFAENGARLEPVANSAPCLTHEPAPHPEHAGEHPADHAPEHTGAAAGMQAQPHPAAQQP